MNDSYKVIYAPAALDDLRAVCSYITFKLKAGQTAKHQTDRIRKEVRSLEFMPERCSKVEWEPWASMQMRKLTVNNYVVYYQVDKENHIVTVIRIVYGGRNIEGIINYE